MEQILCPKCSTQNSPTSYFCANCGEKLKDKPLDTGVAKQIMVYLLSFFLPPFGLIPAFKYLKNPDTKSKYIGIAAVVLTVISIAISAYAVYGMLSVLRSEINAIEQYRGLY